MSNFTFAKYVNEAISHFDQILAERGEMTPAEELDHHLRLLACYWNRMVGSSRMASLELDRLTQSYLGAAVQVSSEHIHRVIGPDHPIHDLWQQYWWRTTTLLHRRPTTLELVENAHAAFEACLPGLNYEPRAKHS